MGQPSLLWCPARWSQKTTEPLPDLGPRYCARVNLRPHRTKFRECLAVDARTVWTPCDSQNVWSRANSRVYFPCTSEDTPCTFLSFRKRSIASCRLRASLFSGVMGTRPDNSSSSRRLPSSASSHDRVPALRRYWTPFWLHRKCLRHRQRRQNSSPAYLQSAECLTKIVMLGVLMLCSVSTKKAQNL